MSPNEAFWTAFFSDRFVQSLVLALPVALASSWLATRMALRKFRSERWWERKAEAYGEIMNGLHDLVRWGEHELSRMQTRVDGETEFGKELKRRAEEAHERTTRAANTSSFLFCQEAQLVLGKLREDLDAAGEGEFPDWTAFVQDYVNAARACLEKLPRIAREELGVDRL